MAWYIDSGGNLTNDEFIEIPAKVMVKPYPAALWRTEPNRNSGFPFHELLPDISGIDMWAMQPKEKIHVYSMWEPQDGFKSNGLAILTPISCSSRQELNGRWDLELVHPLDEWGKWKYLIPMNILKVNGQLFRIDTHIPKISTDSQSITVHANHIFYDLNFDILFLKTFQGGSASAFMDFVFSSSLYYPMPESYKKQYYNSYTFDYGTDISAEAPETYFANTTMTAAFLGTDSSFISMFGGELYRDNFYFSINSRMQYSRDDAFSIRYSLDMTEIEMTVDYNDFCTELHFIDMYGGASGAIGWTPGSVPCAAPQPIIRAVQFNIPLSAQIRYNYWQSVAYPKYTYKVAVASLKHDPRYKDFVNLQNYKLGDKGTVYCEPLNINTPQIISYIERDELSGDILSLTLGSLGSYFSRPSYSNVVSSGNSVTDKQMRTMMETMIGTNITTLQKYSIDTLQTFTINKLQGG